MSEKAHRAALPIQSSVKKKGFFERLWMNRTLYAMLLPGMAVLFVFSYLPMYGILVAFQDFNLMAGVGGSPFVGLMHFRIFMSSPDFYNVLSNTLIISLSKLLLGMPAPILLALMMNEVRNKTYKRIAQTVSYLPYFLSWIIVSGMVTEVLSPSNGIVNVIIKAFGGKPIYFMASKEWFRPVLVISSIWKDCGWGSIIYLAALTNVDPQLHEAASIDGAGKLRRILHINMPYIVPLIAVNFIMSVGGILNAGFDQVFNMMNSRVLPVADIIDTYTYRTGMVNMNYSYSAAVGLFKTLIGLVFVVVSQFVLVMLNKRSASMEVYGLY